MEKILIIGAGGQIGVELCTALRKIYGPQHVIATDLRENTLLTEGEGPFYILDATKPEAIKEIVEKENITQIYHLAAILSAVGETKPLWAWNINMTSLLDILEICKEQKKVHQSNSRFIPLYA